MPDNDLDKAQPTQPANGVTQVSQSVTIYKEGLLLPSSDDLEGYNRALPGGADRLLKMVEKEQEHRHRLEINEQQHRHQVSLRILRDQGRQYIAGRIATGVLALAITAAGSSLIWFNRPIEGFVILAGEVGLILKGGRGKDSKKQKP